MNGMALPWYGIVWYEWYGHAMVWYCIGMVWYDSTSGMIPWYDSIPMVWFDFHLYESVRYENSGSLADW